MVTERKPPGVSFESWADRQIREATERGDFDDLPGKGKPLRGLDKPYDELWWVREKLEREQVSHLPPSLALRKEAQDALEAARNARSEDEVRRILGKLNERIREAVRVPPSGPPHRLVPFDIDRTVREWRERHGS